MEMKQVSPNCYAVLNEKNRLCYANSGLSDRRWRVRMIDHSRARLYHAICEPKNLTRRDIVHCGER
jgi:hypothetical protein